MFNWKGSALLISQKLITFIWESGFVYYQLEIKKWSLPFVQDYKFYVNPPRPVHSESCIEIKIKLNF